MVGIARTASWTLAVSMLASGASAQNWVEIETPHFVVVSNADPRTARNVALEFEQARVVFADAISDDVETVLPVNIFAVRDSADLRVLLPGMGDTLPIGVFLDSPDRHRIAVRLDEPSTLRFQAIYHEYHHLLFRTAVARSPVWLAEGLAEFWSTMELLRNDRVEIGRPSPRHLRALRLGSMMPLQQLLRFNGRVHELAPEHIAIIYAQSWAVVHHLMLGGGANGRKSLERYTALVEQGNDPVEAFELVFGAIDKMERELAEYLDQTMFPAMQLDVPQPPPASEFRTRTLSDAEVSAAIGNFVATGPWPTQARSHLEKALELDPESNAAMEGIGFLHFRQGDFDAAHSWFEKVADADATSYLAHYYLGILAKRTMASPTVVEASLKRSLELNPNFAPALIALSAHIAEDAARLEEALALAQAATRLAPSSGGAWSQLADILTRLNRPEDARRAKERASTSSAP